MARKQVIFRLDPEQERLMRERIDRSGLSRQEYLERAATGTPIVSTDGLLPLVHELKKEGTNLNQVAKDMNSFGRGDHPDLDRVLAALERLYQKAHEVLPDGSNQ